MSEDLELVRSIFAAWEQGDFSAAEWADPEIDFAWVDGPSPARRSGLPGMAEGMRELLSAWQDYRVQAVEYRELDDGRVLVLLYAHGRGKGSGIPLGHASRGTQMGANIFSIRDARVRSIACYFDCENAFADLGIEAQAS